MSIIYSYPETTSLNDNDTLIGTSSALVGGKKKNITRNFSLGEIRDYISSGGVINPAATDFKLAVFNQNGTKITDSIVSQDALTGTGIVVAGTLRSTAATFNGLITGSQGALIYGGDISLNSTTQLGGPVKDAIGNQGFAGQILLSDSSGRVSWTNYSAGLTYQGTWNAATNTPTLTSGQGVNGHFYIVNVAGNTSLDGETDWKVGDWAVFVEQGVNDKWQKIDNTSVLIGEGTPNTIAMWVGGTTPSTTLNDSIITELNNVISIAGDLSTQGLEVNKYLRDGAGNDGTDGQVLTSTTVNGDKEVIWTTPTTGTVTGSGTGQVLSKFSGTGTGQTVLEDSLVSESSSSSLISGLTKSQTGQGGTVQFQQIGPCNPGGGGQVVCSMADVPNVDLSTDPFTGSGASLVEGITFNFLTISDADDFRTLHGITNSGMCSFGGGSATSSFNLTLLFDNGATITFNVPQGQIGIACPGTDQVSLGLRRSGQNAQQYGTALTYVSGSGSISNGDSTVGSIKVSIAATLDMSTNKITNVVNPTDAQDAATKSYVDSATVSGSGTIGTLPVFTGTDVLGDSVVTQSANALTVDLLTKTVTDASAYTINTNIGKLTRTGFVPNPGALTSNVTIGAQYTYGNVDVHGSEIELHTYNLPPNASSPITLWSSSTAGLGIQLRTDGGSITNLAGNYLIQATGAGSGSSPEAIQILSNTGIKFQGQGNAANINFRSYNTNLDDSGDINFISETQEGQAGNITISSIATDAAGTAGEIRLAGAGISTSATDAVPLGLIIASNGHVKTGSVGDTYTINAGVKSGNSVPLNLDAASGTDSTVSLTEGTGITLTRTSATEITIDGVAQGITGSGTVGKLPKFGTTTSLDDSIVTEGNNTTTIIPLNEGGQIQASINFNMQSSVFDMVDYATRNTVTGPAPQVGDVFNFVLTSDLTWAVGGGVIPAGTYPFTVTFVGSGSITCNFNSYQTTSGATGTGYNNLVGNGSSTSVSSSNTLSIDGELSMATHQIKNVVNPTDTQDAATKNYVDSIPRGVMTFGTSDSGATITVSGGAPDPRVKANTTGGVVANSTSLATGGQIKTAIDAAVTGSAANYLPLAGGTMTGNTINNDNVKSVYGAASDGLEVYHDGSNSYIQDTGTGNLLITSDGASVQINKGLTENMAEFIVDGAVKLYYDSSEKLETTSSGISVTGKATSTATVSADATTTLTTKGYVDTKLPLTGGTMTGDISLPDNIKLYAGNGSDLEIYHDPGIGSVINDNGPGDLFIKSNQGVKFTKTGTNELMAQMVPDGSVSIYHDNSKKLETTTTGISITGKATSTATVDADTATTLTTKGYVDTKNADYLPLAGGTMTGAIALPGSPTLALEAATKSYVDNTLAGSGSLIFQGSYDAVNNVPNLTSGTGILKGWTYAVTAGPSTSFWSPPLDVGDLVIANIDNPASASDWTEVQSNIGIAGSGATDLGTTKGIAGFSSDDFTVSSSGWVEAKDFNGSTPGYVPDATSAVAGTFLKEDGTWSTAGVTGTGTQNYVTKWSAGGNGIEDSTIFDTGTNVGIGTTSPSKKLHVNSGTTNEVARFESTDGAAYLSIMDPNTSSSLQGVGSIADSLVMYSNGADRMRIDSSGNVGIGTQSPGAKLEIDGGTGVSTTGGTLVIRQEGDTSSDGIALTSSNSISHRMFKNASGTFLMGPSNNSDAFAMALNGNVGIGTDTPSSLLSVRTAGTSGSQDFATFSRGASTEYEVLKISRSAGSTEFLANQNITLSADYDNNHTSTDSNIILKTDNAERMRINSAGNVGIGTTSPDDNLHIEDSAGSNIILNSNTGAVNNGIYMTEGTSSVPKQVGAYIYYSGSTNKFNIATGVGVPTDRLTIVRDSGDVGIGTSSPVTKLHVDGRITADTHFTSSDSNATLSSSGSGGNVYLRPNGYSNSSGQVIIKDSGNVGIGTDSPGAKLEVKDADPYIRLTDTAAPTGYSQIMGTHQGALVLSADSSDSVASSHLRFDVDGTESMRIDGNGDVGIGTTSPDSKLHIESAATGSVPTLGSDTGFLKISNSGGQYGSMIGQLGSGDGYFQVQRFDGTATAYDLLLQPNGGNVGIGTTSPSSLLNIEGTKNTAILTLGSNYNGSGWSIGDKVGGINFYSADSSGAGSGVKASISYEVTAGSSGATNSLIFSTAGTSSGENNVERMRIDSSGNVGIGTDQPEVSLDLNSNTDAVALPAGDNTARAAISSPTAGMIRYNTTDDQFEGYSGVGAAGSWGALGGSSASGTGTAVTYFDGLAGQASTSLTSDPNIVIDQGYLGVGTDQPDTQLHVKSSVNELLKLESITSSQKIRFTDINNQSDDCDFGSTSGDLAMFTNNFGFPNTQTFTFNKDGKLGINQTLPSYSLDIQDSNFDPAIRLFAPNSSSEILIQANQSFGNNNLINSNTNDLDFQGNGSSIMTLGVNNNPGSVTLGQYGQGQKTGAAAYNLAVDPVGKIIEVAASSAPSIHKETFLNLASNTFDFLLPPNINPIDENYVNIFIDGIYQNTNNINSVTTSPSNVTTVSLVSAAPAGTSVEIVATT